MHIVRDTPLLLEMSAQLLYLAASFEKKTLHDLFVRISPPPRRYARTWLEAERIRALSEVVVYRLPYMAMGNCLKLSLLRYIQLRKRGFNARFHMGVKPSPAGVTGHAWLTLNNEPLWEDASFLKEFRETFAYPKAGD
jgi:hypothetical protein